MIRLIEGALLHRCASGFFNSYMIEKLPRPSQVVEVDSTRSIENHEIIKMLTF